MSRQEVQSQLSQATPVIAPSMLKCDFSRLRDEIEALISAGAGLIHWDVMDGNFVPNLSYGAMVIESVREATTIPCEAHLMISDPAKYVDEYLQAGCDVVTFHVEAVEDPLPLLEKIRNADALAGLAFNPSTPVEAIKPYLDSCDLVLVMSVEPGFGGQKFMPSALDKLTELRKILPGGVRLSVDGGIGSGTTGQTANAGADTFVVGSAIFNTNDYSGAIKMLKSEAESS
ncbi:ribulose-phosphate 3-epimerase [Thalassoroseus pseudoceratinae]|uniref:ribulose-phosphate 3-epimerase n=1 Tax=Thalassoroseus pseudoceratinae TaxID=2713176 RepID=UPI00141E2DE3|nr:ribulose-phosphate 3-epimerase [Thalassoroseus pseudoceratinae]